ncbi:hypothetical protein [Cryobacterium soli]|uniref:hypothetical protein n=1 Tax=Cryobacterium soli TaxID=2220095 RepID=UPI0013C46C34|nr:hypothetical protein [Cryobacterium soli]
MSERAGRISVTLAGTALLVASPTGGSRIVTGVPSAVEAFRALFALPHDSAPLEAACTNDHDHGDAQAGTFTTSLPSGVHWEAFAWWFAAIISARHGSLISASALAHTERGPVAVEFIDGRIRASPISALPGRGSVQFTFSESLSTGTETEMLKSLKDVMTRSAPRADSRR